MPREPHALRKSPKKKGKNIYLEIRNMAGMSSRLGSGWRFHSAMARVRINSWPVVMPAATHSLVAGRKADSKDWSILRLR